MINCGIFITNFFIYGDLTLKYQSLNMSPFEISDVFADFILILFFAYKSIFWKFNGQNSK